MAWKARIDWVRADTGTDTRLVGVSFFDEENRDTVYSETCTFDSSVTKAQALTKIQTRGQKIRDRVTATATALPDVVGTEIPIP